MAEMTSSLEIPVLDSPHVKGRSVYSNVANREFGAVATADPDLTA